MKYADSVVKYLDYNDEQIPYVINFYVIGKWKVETKKEISDIDLEASNFDVSLYEPLLYHSLKVGHLILKKDFKLKREDMESILSVNMIEFIEGIKSFSQELVSEEVKKLMSNQVIPTQ